MKDVWIRWFLGLYFYGLHFTYAVKHHYLTCLQPTMPYTELFMQSNNQELQQALSVLLEDQLDGEFSSL